MARKKKSPPVEAESLPDFVGDVNTVAHSDDALTTVSSADIERLDLVLAKLDAAGRVMEAQARLLEAYELRQSRVQALAELADARKAWEVVNG